EMQGRKGFLESERLPNVGRAAAPARRTVQGRGEFPPRRLQTAPFASHNVGRSFRQQLVRRRRQATFPKRKSLVRKRDAPAEMRRKSWIARRERMQLRLGRRRNER